jgi:SAM-dependent methyltransferase
MVTGIDASAVMVERTSQRSTEGSAGDIHAEVLDIGQIGARFQSGEFDGIISCFGSLNTQASLGTFAADASELLRPGGRMIIHILNGWSIWEWASLTSRGKWKAACALGRQRERDFEIGGVTVTHFVENPGDEYMAYFEGQFRLRSMYGLGIFRPPAPSSVFQPRMLDLLERADILAGRYRPFRGWARFTVLELEKWCGG